MRLDEGAEPGKVRLPQQVDGTVRQGVGGAHLPRIRAGRNRNDQGARNRNRTWHNDLPP
jgi:hypothetical protein